MNIVNWKKVWLLPNVYFITNKIKEVTFRLIQRICIYPAKHFLVKFKKRYRCKLSLLQFMSSFDDYLFVLDVQILRKETTLFSI